MTKNETIEFDKILKENLKLKNVVKVLEKYFEKNENLKLKDILKVKKIAIEDNLNKFVGFLLKNPDLSHAPLVNFFKTHSKSSERETLFRKVNIDYLKKEYGKICCYCDY